MKRQFRYPDFNDPLHSRSVLTAYGRTPLGELIWLCIPLAVLILALLAR